MAFTGRAIYDTNPQSLIEQVLIFNREAANTLALQNGPQFLLHQVSLSHAVNTADPKFVIKF
jgi:hypothetical protein